MAALPVRSHRTFLLLLSLLLPALTTGCTLERIAVPGQNPAVSAQAAEQTPSSDTDVSSTEDAPESGAGSVASETATAEAATAKASAPEPPKLMSQASSTAAQANALNSDQGSDQGFNQGPLRLGNQTPHPLRIAFLAQGQPRTGNQPEATAADAQPSAQANDAEIDSVELTSPDLAGSDQEPFHWDFAPEEGGRDGLLLALPERDLLLQNGDIVVAFAQDGSQRYWGPYVVGQTSLPYWNGDRQEWQLLVQP